MVASTDELSQASGIPRESSLFIFELDWWLESKISFTNIILQFDTNYSCRNQSFLSYQIYLKSYTLRYRTILFMTCSRSQILSYWFTIANLGCLILKSNFTKKNIFAQGLMFLPVSFIQSQATSYCLSILYSFGFLNHLSMGWITVLYSIGISHRNVNRFNLRESGCQDWKNWIKWSCQTLATDFLHKYFYPSRMKRGGNSEICTGIATKWRDVTCLSVSHRIHLPHHWS